MSLRLLVALGLLMFAGEARAQSVIATVPPVTGFGVLAVTGSSALLSADLTVGPNSAAWPPPPGATTFVINPTGSGGTIYICPLGGTCASSSGIPITTGNAYGFFKLSASATIIGSTTLTAAVQW